jgi:hypothetical protein
MRSLGAAVPGDDVHVDADFAGRPDARDLGGDLRLPRDRNLRA